MVPHNGARRELRTDRLLLREAEAADLEDMHRVFSSDPKLRQLRPDIEEAGGYDLAAVRRYWEAARLDPVRHVLIVADVATGGTVGIVDFVTESSADGIPWIGLVLIDGDHQRRGLGSEALVAVLAQLTPTGHGVARMAVLEGDDAGLAFARSVGFRERSDARTPAPARRAVVMEIDLPVSLGGVGG